MGLIAGLLRYILMGVVIWVLYRVLRSWMAGPVRQNQDNLRGGGGQVLDVMVQDPQCGTYVPRQEALRVVVNGQERYFCSEACRDAYLAASKVK